MITIPIQVCGDVWDNRAQVQEQLDKTHPGQAVMLDLCSEGPSLHKLGITDLLSSYELDISITRWSNSVEQVPYKKVFCNSQSHFYPMSLHYWIDEIPNLVPAEFKFALFIGRATAPRARIFYDVAHHWPGQFLLSKMSTRVNPNPWTMSVRETPGSWFADIDQTWFASCGISSIDNRSVQDQYRIPEISAAEVAKSLMAHYHRFNIELVCETYTLGDTFFATEKTVRAIVGNRPFVVYGPKNYLYNLRSQEGFKTFSDLWDESYDLLEGMDRWQAIQQLIHVLASMNESQWHDLVVAAAEVTKHNRTVLKKIIDDRKKI